MWAGTHVKRGSNSENSEMEYCCIVGTGRGCVVVRLLRAIPCTLTPCIVPNEFYRRRKKWNRRLRRRLQVPRSCKTVLCPLHSLMIQHTYRHPERTSVPITARREREFLAQSRSVLCTRREDDGTHDLDECYQVRILHCYPITRNPKRVDSVRLLPSQYVSKRGTVGLT
jgi:hypothetical protein